MSHINDTSSTTKVGLGFSEVLTLIFVVLKLTHVIDWKWVWVLSPVWVSLGLWLLVVCVFLVGGAVVRHRKRRIQQKVMIREVKPGTET